jgi:hypothetical protein
VTTRARAAAAVGLTALVLTGCAGTDPGSDGAAAARSTSSSSASAAGAEHSGQDGAEATGGHRLAVEIRGGQVSGDTGRVPVELGDQVTLTVTSDAADELHLHGYDLEAELAPGEPATLSFTADIPGVFEAELHEAGTVLLSLQVG